MGRLAGLGWFARRGEVAATQALKMLLEERPLRDALLRYLREITQSNLGAVDAFQTELTDEDRSRPDLVGTDSDGRRIVVVEAKFGAKLDSAQVQAYLTNLETKLGVDGDGALILLVPSYRRPEAEAVLSSVGTRPTGHDTSAASLSTAVVTWDEWLGVWDEAVREFSPSEQNAVRCDLTQLRELCKTMVGLDIPPLGLAAKGHEWQDRERDLHQLVDQATRPFIPAGTVFPFGDEPEFSFHRRYLPGGLPDPDWTSPVSTDTGD